MKARLSIICGAALVLSAIVAGVAYVAALPRALTWGIERRMTNCATPSLRCAPPGFFLHKRTLA
ncbi:MAG: hypothetical protein KGM42_21295, partial [Hyphomicrobiales bacterium]|nr:hypothetical protein [Hyphomicrobiales bacterium]